MQTAVEPLDDTESLRRVRDTSIHSQGGLSDTASLRLLRIETASFIDQTSLPALVTTFIPWPLLTSRCCTVRAVGFACRTLCLNAASGTLSI